MGSTSIVRKIDAMGRLVLPVELRKNLGLTFDDSLEILIDDESIVLKKYVPACIFCGEAAGLTDFKGKKICPNCRKELETEPAPVDDQMYFYLMGHLDSLIKQLREMKKRNGEADPIPLLKSILQSGEALYRSLKAEGGA